MIRPVLSGCARGGSFRPFLALDHRPALEPGYRPVLLDPHDVADREFVLLVVGVIILGAPYRLLEERMGEAALDADNHRLVLLVAYQRALAHAFRHPVLFISPCVARPASPARRSGSGRCRAAPAAPAPCSRADRSPA